MMKDESTFECIGEFPLIDAKRIINLFDEAGIMFESEIDDTEGLVYC